MHIDKLDAQILAILRRDGRASHAKIASQLGVARATVKSRIDRLEQNRTITGYTALTVDRLEVAQVRAMTSLKILGHKTSRIVDQLLRVKQITTIHSTNGKWDLIVEIEADDIGQLDLALEAIRQNEGIAESETSILLRRL